MGKVLKLYNKRKRGSTRLYLNCAENKKGLFEEFCEKTSIHGIKYLGDNRTSRPERAWWFIIIAISCCFCIKLIRNSYEKWEKYPVVTTFANSPANVWEIPFPAVTICPEVKVQNRILNYTNAVAKIQQNIMLNEEEQLYYDYLALLCDNSESNVTTFQNRRPVYENLLKMAPSSRSFAVFERGDWKDLTPIITSEGVCYTFNILDRTELFYNPIIGFGEVNILSEWTVEEGYFVDNLDEEYIYFTTYPRRTWIAGSKGRINIRMYTAEADIDDACRDSLQGYKVALHSPAEVPRIEQQYFRVSLDEHVTVVVQPKVIRTSETLKDYDPLVKKCFHQKDKPLKYYKIYTEQNCINECFANMTQIICGCMEFHMAVDVTTPVCGPSSQECVKEVVGCLLNGKPLKTIETPTFNGSCECLPSCISLKYDAELSHTQFDWRKEADLYFTAEYVRSINSTDSFLQGHLGQLELYMKEEQFISLERHELYDSTDFWASCGGILGLCMGVSLFSVLEIIYFCSLKICCAIKAKRKEKCNVGGADELLECKTIA